MGKETSTPRGRGFVLTLEGALKCSGENPKS
jgi:hypothetical protein